MKSIACLLVLSAALSLVACSSSPDGGESSDVSEVNASPTEDQTGQGMNDIIAKQYDRYLRGDNSPNKSPGGHWRAVSYSANAHVMSAAEAGEQHVVFTHMSEGGGAASMVTRFYAGDPRATDVGNGYASTGTFGLVVKAVDGYAVELTLDETRTSPGMPLDVKTKYMITMPGKAPEGPAKVGDQLTLSSLVTPPNGRPEVVTISFVRDEAPTYCDGFAGPDEPDSYCAGQMVSISIPNTQWCPMSHACVEHQCQPGCIAR